MFCIAIFATLYSLQTEVRRHNSEVEKFVAFPPEGILGEPVTIRTSADSIFTVTKNYAKGDSVFILEIPGDLVGRKKDVEILLPLTEYNRLRFAVKIVQEPPPVTIEVTRADPHRVRLKIKTSDMTADSSVKTIRFGVFGRVQPQTWSVKTATPE